MPDYYTQRFYSVAKLLMLVVLMLGIIACGSPDAPESPAPSDNRQLPGLNQGRSVAEAEEMPAFTLPTPSGATFSSDQLDGDVLLVNFWATWCGPCIEEMPDLSALHTTYQEQGFSVVGISLDADGAQVVADYLEAQPVSYPVVLDDGVVADKFGGVWGLPVSFLIDRDGTIVRRFIGLFPVETARPMIEDLLG